MRTLVDIPDSQVGDLARLCERDGISRAAAIRAAVAAYLAERSPATDATRDAFGLWGDGVPDGLAYQEKLRAEW